MISTVPQVENGPAPRNVAETGNLRPDGERRHPSREDYSRSGRDGGRQEQRQGLPRANLRAAPRENPHEDPPEARPAPEEPGLIMARQLAGDDKSDAALGRLLDDLDGLENAAPEDEGPRDPAQPVAPFVPRRRHEGPYYLAASAYQWGQQALNSGDILRPGVVYSEQF